MLIFVKNFLIALCRNSFSQNPSRVFCFIIDALFCNFVVSFIVIFLLQPSFFLLLAHFFRPRFYSYLQASVKIDHIPSCLFLPISFLKPFCLHSVTISCMLCCVFSHNNLFAVAFLLFRRCFHLQTLALDIVWPFLGSKLPQGFGKMPFASNDFYILCHFL